MGQDHSVWEFSGDVQSIGDEEGHIGSSNSGLTNSSWDPDPGGIRACDLTYFEIDGCKLLLIEVIRLTVFDWVLCRNSSNYLKKQIAEDAYHWLFVEEPGTRAWAKRKCSKKELTSLIGICEVLSIDPDVIRAYAKRLTPKDVACRPNSYRRRGDRAYQQPTRKKLLQERINPRADVVSKEVEKVGVLYVRPNASAPMNIAQIVRKASVTAIALKTLLRQAM